MSRGCRASAPHSRPASAERRARPRDDDSSWESSGALFLTLGACCSGVMARMSLRGLVSSLLVTAAVSAQAGANGLEVRPDPQNVVANALVGTWKFDAELGKRLGNNGIGERLEFRDDAKVVEKVPAGIAAKLRDRRIYLAGVMVLRGKEQPFVLTEHSGNPTVVWFRD